MIWFIATCSSNDSADGCPTPPPGTTQSRLLDQARAQASFDLLYPCDLPGGQSLTSMAVTGQPGRQLAELVFEGPFDLTLRQSQYAPAPASDPAGASRIVIDLFPNVRATLTERNDGSNKALYHLLWQRDGLYYEVQASGPPLQRQAILDLARSLR